VSPSVGRNKQPILDVLAGHLQARGDLDVLELAAGTGAGKRKHGLLPFPYL
jgi:hypothetical protein